MCVPSSRRLQLFLIIACPASRFQIGLGIAIPSAVLVILFRLYKISSMSNTGMTKAEKRRSIIIDLSVGLGIPFLYMPLGGCFPYTRNSMRGLTHSLEYIVQSNRFNIIEDIGCMWTVYNTPVAWILFHPWPLFISALACAFGGMSFRSRVSIHPLILCPSPCSLAPSDPYNAVQRARLVKSWHQPKSIYSAHEHGYHHSRLYARL